MNMGEKIRYARQAAGLSQRQLCDGIVTRNMLSQIENGSAKPSLATLQALAQRLGQNVQYFLEEGEPMQTQSVSVRREEQDDELLLCWAVAAVKKGEILRAEHLLAAVETPGSDSWHLAKGCILAARGEYETASIHLRRGESKNPGVAWTHLELCCRELGDYKGAYLYACKLRERD